MLLARRDPRTGELRLLIRQELAEEAWISCSPIPCVDDRRDWRLWVRLTPREPARAGKSPTRLMIESRLRAWLLQRFRRRLSDLSFEELLLIAQGKHPTRRRRVTIRS